MVSYRRSLFLVPPILFVCLLLGPVYGASPQSRGTVPGEDLHSSLKTFTKIYDVLEANFADRLDPDKAIYSGAVPGMLRTLDPHSNFLAPKEFQSFREDQQGHYFGVGMWVGMPNGKVAVVYPFLNSPAWKAGIRPGDVIVAVDDKSTEQANTAIVSALLKGPRGTKVQVAVKRDGHDTPLTFNLTRDAVPRPSVKNALWMRPGIAYLQVTSFNETTSREIEDGLKRLGESSIEGLIIDLRNNPGGILQEAVAATDRFLQKGQLIVSHRGRSSAESKFVAKRGNSGRDYPIVVLVNSQSASAAEIMAGALQDHDRAWILGEKTFGKGLVQSPYQLSENSALLLTIAKYYTPSGRLIQRDYSNKSFFEYYYGRGRNLKNSRDFKSTDTGRSVHGGDGITPDELFVEPARNLLQVRILNSFALYNFTAGYFGRHETSLPRDWQPADDVVEQFHAFLGTNQFPVSEAEWTENRSWIKQQLRLEMYTTAFSKEDSERLALQTDAGIRNAISALPKSKALLQKAKHPTTLRAAGQPLPANPAP